MRLTAKERILLYLLEASPPGEAVEVSPDLTQEGVARGSWIDVRHVPQYVRPLINEGLIRERQAHVKGIRQRRKVYDLTHSGRFAAIRLRDVVKAEIVQVREASGVRDSTISQVLVQTGGTPSLLEIARQAIEAGVVDLSTPALASAPGTDDDLPNVASLESAYDWMGAADACKAALRTTASDAFLQRGTLGEHLGNALVRAAMQAGNKDEVRQRMETSIEALEAAKSAYGKLHESESGPRVLRCQATAALAKFWLANTNDDRGRQLEDAWQSAKAALKAFEDAGTVREIGRSLDRLSIVHGLRYAATWDVNSRESSLREFIDCGDRAIMMLQTGGDPRELSKACAATAAARVSLLNGCARPEEEDGLLLKSRELWRRAMELSPGTALTELWMGPWLGGDGTDASVAESARGVDFAKKTGDRLLIGWALRTLAYQQFWKSYGVEDLDEWRRVLKGGLEASDEAKRSFEAIGYTNMGGGSFTPACAHATYYFELSRREVDRQTRHDLLIVGLDCARRNAKQAEAAGFPDALIETHGTYWDLLMGLADLEADSGARRQWLREALEHADRVKGIMEQHLPAAHYNQGDQKMARGRLMYKLAELTEVSRDRIALLEQAASETEAAIDICLPALRLFERRGEVVGYAYMGISLSNWPDMLIRLYQLTGNSSHLTRAGEALERAAEYYRKPDLPSVIAECQWKAGQVYDLLEDHTKAAEEFASASTSYKIAQERVPQLKEFYQDLALYMQAWSEIEKARHHHGMAEYGQAKDYYERAATLHGFSRKWRFMAPNYAAWAQLEDAEDLSRAEKGAEAIAAFERAGGLFREAKSALEGALDKIEDLDERAMVDSLAEAIDHRWRYCVDRVALEEARLLDKKGEHPSSSRRYGQAADGFERLAKEADSDRDRRDLGLIATLARAWQAMATAEADGSPEMYAEASRFFEAARDLSPGERSKALASGHSRFCLAMEAGAQFADTRDPAQYGIAIRHLDSAAGHYARAGVESASEYARASKFLFDAYAAMDRAGQENDTEKKAKDYLAVEKILDAAAVAFQAAGQPGKEDQARRLLEGVRRERELAVALIETLRAPGIASSTSGFAAPAPTYEKAVGVEQLEHADIRAGLIPARMAAAVGQDFDVTIKLVNAGRAPGQLVKIEGIVPKGFQLVEGPGKYGVEGGSVNLNGRRLESLRTEQLRVVLRPLATGACTFRLRVTYLDESGNSRLCEPEPVEVLVSGKR